MGKTFQYCPQLEALEDRLPPGDLLGGLSIIGRGGEVLPAAARGGAKCSPRPPSFTASP
jgi:hypothetical protein